MSGYNNSAVSDLGSLITSDNLTLNVQQLNNQGTKAQDKVPAQGVQANYLILNTEFLNNQQGGIYTTNTAEISTKTHLNNQQGELLSGDKITLNHDGELTVNNQDGTIQGHNLINLNAKKLEVEGIIKTAGNLNISLQDSFTLNKAFSVGNHLNFSTQGHFENNSALLVKGNASISANKITNNRDAEISANHTALDTDTLINRGLIDGYKTHIQGKNITNIGTGRIYGDYLAFNSKQVSNINENDHSATLAARERLDLGANKVINHNGSMIMSLGAIYFGNELDAKQRAIGQASLIENHNAIIEAMGDISLNVKKVENLHNLLEVEIQETAKTPIFEYGFANESSRYAKEGITKVKRGDSGGFNKKVRNLYALRLPDGRESESWREYNYIRTVNETVILPAKYAEAKILSGGHINFFAADVKNYDSKIIAHTGITYNGGTIDNHATKGTVITTDEGRMTYFYDGRACAKKLFGKCIDHYKTTQSSSSPYTVRTETTKNLGLWDYIPLKSEQFSLTKEIETQNTAKKTQLSAVVIKSSSATVINSIGKREDANHIENLPIAKTHLTDVTLPTSSLYRINPDHPNGYLVETDPKFTQHRQWLSSDYMFNQLRHEHNNVHKRLGDGYYEQRLINEQINQLTGRRFLTGYNNELEQYKALMNEGVKYAKQFDLILGIALTKEQMSELTTDMVWFVNKVFTLPNGQKITALVPQVYLVPRHSDITAQGALISANTIIGTLDNVQNSGVIAGRKLTQINAEQINNQGIILGDTVDLSAKQHLINLGGKIEAVDKLSLSAGKNLEIASTLRETKTSTDFARRVVDKMSQLKVSGEKGKLSLQADGDLTVKGALIESQGNIEAIAKNIESGTLAVYNKEHYNADADNYYRLNQKTEVGSLLQGKEGVTLITQDEMKLRQAQISSEQGNINLAALAGNIHVEAGQEKEHITSSTKSTSKGWFSKTTEIRRHEHKFDNALGSSLDGKNISLIAGGNIHLQGTQAKAEQNIELSARGNINIDAVKNRHEQMTWEKYEKSGLHASFKGGTAQIGLGATKSKLNTNSVDETVVGSSLIAKENLTVVSKGALLINAAQLGANKDMTLQGQNVHINALTEQHQRSLYRYAKSIGMNIGITYSPLLAGLTRGKETLDEQGFKNRSTIGKVMSLADAGYEAFERSYKPVTFSVSASKQSLNQNEKQQLAVASEIVAGQNLNIIANKGDIISQGATLQAEGDLSLVAKEDIQLNTAMSRITRNAHSKQQGIQFDTSKSWLKEFGVYSNKQKENDAEIRHQSTSISVGGNSLLFSGKDIKTQGADIAVDGDIQLVAKGNITLGTSHNEQHNQSKSKGIGIGHAKLSDTEHFTGLNLDRSQQKGNNIPHKGTILGSTAGNVSIYTEQNYLQDSSAVIANNGKVNIVATNNIISRSQDNTSLMTGYSRGTKVGVFAKVSSPLLDALNLVQQGQHLVKEDKSNNRLKALQAGVLAWQGYDTYSAIKSGALLRAEAGIGFSHGQSSYRQSAVESQGNFINGKQGVTLQANQGKIDLSHIQLSSKDTLGNIMPDSYIELKAKEGIALSSGRAEYQHNQKQMKAGAQVGLGVQAGTGTGAYVYVEAGYQQGKQQSHSHQKHNSRVETANFKAESGKDIELQGASVYANKINVQADGNLRIISEQSESHSKSQQTGANIRAQASLGTAWGFSGSFNQHKGKENRKQVEEQAGLFAGKGGYQVSADKVSLVGGAIVSTAEKAKNQLIARDFQFKDIQNESNAKASSLALMGGFSINRDQTSAEDKKLNKLYREEKLKKGETFHQANQNTNHQGLKFGLNNQDVHSNDLYAASKLLLANALGNSQTQSSDSTVTKSVVSEGEFHIASETGKQQLAKVSKDSASSNQKVADYDMDKMLSENKTKTEVNKFLLGKVAAGTDEAYRTMFIAEHRLMTFELDENGNLIKDQERIKVLEKLAKEKYKKEKPNISEDKFIKEYIFENPLGINVYKLREVSDKERQSLDKVTYFDPKTKTYKSGVAVMFNGILNDQQAAAKYAVQNYIAEKDGASIYKNIYFVHHPEADNVVSELLIASYQKYLEGGIGSLGNSTLQAKNIMERYGIQGLYIGSHSRGTLTVDNALRELDKYDNRGILSNTKVKMVGPAADVNQANRRFIRLQGNNSKESIRFENNKLDSVGSLIGSNPYTTKTNINNFGIFKRTYDLLFGDTSAHNCYGIGNPQCINDGYRKDKLMNLEVPFTELEKSKDKE